MKYAVFQTGGKQYKVSVGTTLEIEKIEGEPEGSVKFDEVLLIADEGKVQLGAPFLSGASVAGKILEQKKGQKIRVAKFKAKSRYRRVQGHRQLLTAIEITKIASGKELSTKTESKSK